MHYTPLGRTGMNVSRLCLGTMMFGSWGNQDTVESLATIHAAIDAGVNFIDTADVYSTGEAERIVGEAIRERRDEIVLATKFSRPMGTDPDHRGGSRRWVVRACDDSLRRLGTDRIDLYQMHRPDPATDIDETLSALSDLIRAGKVLAIGTSTFPPSQLVEAQWISDRRGHARFASEQPPYSMLVRGIEADVLPTCRRHGVAVLPWSPLASGWLSGKWRRDAAPSDLTSRRAELIAERFDLRLPENQRKLDAADALARLAEQSGLSLIHLALRFALSHPAVTSVIIGPRTLDHLRSQVDVDPRPLDGEVLDEIDRIVAPGHNFLVSDSGYLPPSLVDPQERRR